MYKGMVGYVVLKLLPLWVSKLIYNTGLLDAFVPYTKYATMSSETYLNNLTENKALRAVLAYSYGDYGM